MVTMIEVKAYKEFNRLVSKYETNGELDTNFCMTLQDKVQKQYNLTDNQILRIYYVTYSVPTIHRLYNM